VAELESRVEVLGRALGRYPEQPPAVLAPDPQVVVLRPENGTERIDGGVVQRPFGPEREEEGVGVHRVSVPSRDRAVSAVALRASSGHSQRQG
jgi:hypothetical protein